MAMKAMRSRLMAYTRGMPGAPRLRDRLARVESLAELEDLATSDLADEMCALDPVA
jgi:tRNA-dihydrouridine synthase